MARYIAIDWDQNQLHIIAADVRPRGVRVQKAVAIETDGSPNPALAEELGRLLKDKLREAGISPAPVLACLGRDRLIVKEIRFPSVPDSEEPAIVRFQTIKELTDAPEETVIDYVVTGGQPGGERKASALVVRKEMLQTYQTICQTAGMKLAALTPRLPGIAECLRKVIATTVVTPAPEPADGVIAVVVVQEKTAEFAILKGDVFVMTRSTPATTNLAGDVRRNIAVYSGQHPNNPVCAVYVAGKGGEDLRLRLGEMLTVPVHVFDPFAGSETLEMPTGHRGGFAGAMGLLHIRSKGDMPINFVSPRQPKPPSNPNYRLIRTAALAVVVLIIGLVIMGRMLHASYTEEADALDARRKEVETSLQRTRDQAKRFKGINDWDIPVTLDELYELTARIPDVNALRVESVTLEPLARTPSMQYAARMSIKGKLLDKRDPRKPLYGLIANFNREGFYTCEQPRIINNSEFELYVNVKRRPPTSYNAVVKVEEPKYAPRQSDKSETETEEKDGEKTNEKKDAKEPEEKDKSATEKRNKGGVGRIRGMKNKGQD